MEQRQVVLSDGPELVRLLTEMKEDLDELQNKIEPLSKKVKDGCYKTSDGLSYLETKHLMLLCYRQFIMFYLLLKAEGQSVRDHPVIMRFVEIRMFLEKIRPIDKKLQYQLDKLSRIAKGLSLETRKDHSGVAAENEDALKYKPNPDMLVPKIDQDAIENGGIYRPPMLAPTAMIEDRASKEGKEKSRIENAALHRAARNAFIKDLANELQGRPEEIKEFVGVESKEMWRENARLDARARQEEELFTRVPLTKAEKQRLKHLKQSRNGLIGMIDDFGDEVTGLVGMEEDKTIAGPAANHFKLQQRTRRQFIKGKRSRPLIH